MDTIRIPTKTGDSSPASGAGGGEGSSSHPSVGAPSSSSQAMNNFFYANGGMCFTDGGGGRMNMMNDAMFSAGGAAHNMGGMTGNMNNCGMGHGFHGFYPAMNGFGNAMIGGPVGGGASAYSNNNNVSNPGFSTVTTVPTKGGGGAAGTPGADDIGGGDGLGDLGEQHQHQQPFQQGAVGGGDVNAQRDAMHRRQSSSSSLDVAATLFSSIQSLEAAGGSLASLGMLGHQSVGAGSNTGAPASAGLNAFGGVHSLGNFGAGIRSNYGQFGGLHLGATTGNNANLASLNGANLNGSNATHPFMGSAAGLGPGAAANGFAGRLSSSLSRSNSNNSLQSHFEEMMASGLTATGGAGTPSAAATALYSVRNNVAGAQQALARHRRLEEDEQLFFQQRTQLHQQQLRREQEAQSLSGNTHQVAGMAPSSRLNALNLASSAFASGGFIPTSTSTSRRSSRNILEGFSQEELLNEVLSRRNSRHLLDEMSRCSSRNDFSDFLGGAGIGAGFNRQNSLGSHHSLTALLASATNTERGAGLVGETMTVPIRDSHEENVGDGSIPRVIVSTKQDDGPSSTKEGGADAGQDNEETGGDENDANTATVVTTEDATANTNSGKFTTKKRSNSTSSLDALLSVFGDELAELDREKSGAAAVDDDKSTTSSLGFFSSVMIEAEAARKFKEKEEREDKKPPPRSSTDKDLDSDGESRTFSRRESLSSASDNDAQKQSLPPFEEKHGKPATAAQNSSHRSLVDSMLGRETDHPNQAGHLPSTNATNSNVVGLSTSKDYAMMQTNNAMMAAMIQGDIPLRAMAMQGLPIGNSGMMPNVVSPLERVVFGQQMNPINLNLSEEMLAKLIQAKHLQILQGNSSAQDNVPTLPLPTEGQVEVDREETPSVPEKPPVEEFLEKYGESGQKSQESMLKAISDSEESLAAIHAWDRSQGLRKCHSRTVVKTRRTRAKIKAFLMGVEPPPEPTRNRKRKTKNSDTNDADFPPSVGKKKKKGGAAKQLMLRASESEQ